MNHSTDVDLLLLDQRRRWRQGDAVRVESYLEQQPALHDNPEGLLDLIYNEIVVRQEAGDTPQLEEYVERFPHFADQLGVQFEVHQAIESNSLTPFVSVGRERAFLLQRRPVGPALPSGFLLAGYEIREELGRGGMGIVYKAQQLSLKRLVALKMILAGPQATAREIARFRAEAEAVARLQHPHIVQIHEVGEQDGLPFFSLELVDGPSLEKRVGGRPLAPLPAARLVEVLARAVQYAHQRGILHRDLKPSNILLAGGSETPLEECVPKITDFGLAVDLATVSPDMRGGLLGTPSYVAPEQAAGAEVGPAVDVYALGAILYYLLTGRPPFRAESVWATLEQVRSQAPIPPTHWQPRLPRDLETICLKCLAKDPGRRYSSAAELAEDLRRFSAGEPIQARPATVWGRLAKWCRRRPAVASLVGVSITAVLALTLLGLWHVVEVRAREHLARAGQRLEENARLEAARASFQLFIQGRDEAVFRGLRTTLFDDAEAAGERAATEAAVQDVLAQVHLTVDSESGPRFEPYWSEQERAEVSVGCYQLLLILSDASHPRPGQAAQERPAGLARALAILDRAARLVPPTPAYHLRRARLLGEMGDPAAAQRERRQAEQLRPAGMIDYFWLGEEWFEQGDLQRAVLAFEQALRLQPDDFGSAFYLALSYLRLGEPSKARDCLTRCRTRRAPCVWTDLLSALVHESLREYDLAEADYQRALELEPQSAAGYVLHVDRGRLRFRRGQFEGAIDDLEQAIVHRPEHGHAYLILARVYQKQGKWAESDQQLARAMQLAPTAQQRAQCLRERGRNRFLARRYQEAIEACEAALKAQPGDADSQLLRARALLQLERYAEAAAGFDRYLRSGGKAVADGYRGRGQARLQLQDYLGARDDYTHALELEPADAELYAHRGWAYFFADAWKPALRDFEEAIRRDPKAAPSYCGLGLARVMLGSYREAVRDAEEALRRGLEAPAMRLNAACIFALAAGKAEKDVAAADARALAGGYRQRAVEILRSTLTLLPEAERGPFWRDKVLPDTALDPIRGERAFEQLAAEWATSAP